MSLAQQRDIGAAERICQQFAEVADQRVASAQALGEIATEDQRQRARRAEESAELWHRYFLRMVYLGGAGWVLVVLILAAQVLRSFSGGAK